MKILIVHNKYTKRGGEDVVVQNELNMLREFGHTAQVLYVDNRDQITENFLNNIKIASNTVWSVPAYKTIYSQLKEFRPDIMHVHNFFPLLSPSIFWAAYKLNIKCVLTLHNYRLVCANALMYKEGAICNKCLKSTIHSLIYRCYRNSFFATLPINCMNLMHKAIKTWENNKISLIALTDFQKNILVQAGLPANRLFVKPNCIKTTNTNQSNLTTRRKSLVFIGRFSPEKGVDRLMKAWESINQWEWNLHMIGDGEMASYLKHNFSHLKNIIWHGWLAKDEVLEQLAMSKYSIISSKCYEGFPNTVLESMVCGTPIIAPHRGAFSDIIKGCGLLYNPNLSTGLSEMINQAIALDDTAWNQLSTQCKKQVNMKYSLHVNYTKLTYIYDELLNRT